MTERRLYYPSPIDLTAILANARAAEASGSGPLTDEQLSDIVTKGMKKRKDPKWAAAIAKLKARTGDIEGPESYDW